MGIVKGSEPFFIPKESRELFERKEENLEIWKVDKCLARRGATFRRSISKMLRGLHIRRLLKLNNVTCWLVDGERVRLIDDDFTMGGHGARYLYIPLDEIWIDRACRNWRPLFVHEYAEYRLMLHEGMNYGDAHDVASKIEITIRQGIGFVLPVGHFEQERAYTCGAASLRIVLDYLGYRMTEQELARRSKTGVDHGVDPVDLVQAARSLGHKVTWHEGWTIRAVKKVLHNGLPIIANHQQSRGYGEGHYAVIIGYTRKDEFVIADPACDDRFRLVPIRKFMNLWYEEEDDTVREGIVVH